MTLVLPTAEQSLTYPAQAVTDATDLGALGSAVQQTGVVSGCTVAALSTPGMAVSVAAGTVLAAGVSVPVAAVSSLTIATAPSTGDRRDIVVSSSAGVVSVVEGTANSATGWTGTSTFLPPVKPAVPSGSVLLGEVYVAQAVTSIVAGAVVDKTTVVDPIHVPYFGDGSDGDATVTASTYMGGDVYYANLTINSGVSYKTNGYRVFVSGTLTNNGSINFNPNPSVGTGNGGNGNAPQTTGGGQPAASGSTGVGTSPGAITDAIGGAGGAGGSGASGAGGAGGTVSNSAATRGGPRTGSVPVQASLGQASQAGTSPVVISGGAAGGTGAGDGTNSGGAGGNGAGTCLVVARQITGNGNIEAVGSPGGTPPTGNCGGGGGGGGGVVILVTATPSNPWTVDVSGGAAGAGVGTGVAGTAGSAGNTFIHLGV